jgi:hypothetical protein
LQWLADITTESVRFVATEPKEGNLAKGQQRSNREKKKPKADKNKSKIEPAVSPFASARFPGKPAQGDPRKKTP